jgi:hypothetical protein
MRSWSESVAPAADRADGGQLSAGARRGASWRALTSMGWRPLFLGPTALRLNVLAGARPTVRGERLSMPTATKFWQHVGAAIAAALCYAAPAAADTASFDDNVFRYRSDTRNFEFHLDLQLASQGADSPTRVEARADPAVVTTGPGCRAVQPGPLWVGPGVLVVCPLSGPLGGRRGVRYRLSLTRAADMVNTGGLEKGVVFAGGGQDEVYGDRLYGGRGHDTLEGKRVFGGPGVDRISAFDERGTVLRGGPGGDEFFPAGRVYGGPGADNIVELGFVSDMFVGGPGRDTLETFRDRRQDITRFRGGGADRIACDGPIDAFDVLLVDGSDRVGARCRTGRVLLSGRPGRLWP